MAPQRPKGTGRKKIEIKPIEDEEARQVCFSKRRRGVFNKATELAVMCDLEVAAVAFSPSGHKVFTVGHPSVKSVLDRFCPSNSPQAQDVAAVGGGAPDPPLAELDREDGELRARMDAVKARKAAAKEVSAKARAEGCQASAWFHNEVSEMGEEDLVAFEAALEKMLGAVAAHANQVLQEALLVGPTVHGGAGGGDIGLGVGGTWASSGMETGPWMEMMRLQQEMVMAMPPPPATGLAAGMETMQQQMVAMPPGSAAGMETVVPHQSFGPHGFPQ